eukprot:4883009-Amphidinium_carterae.2
MMCLRLPRTLPVASDFILQQLCFICLRLSTAGAQALVNEGSLCDSTKDSLISPLKLLAFDRKQLPSALHSTLVWAASPMCFLGHALQLTSGRAELIQRSDTRAGGLAALVAGPATPLEESSTC